MMDKAEAAIVRYDMLRVGDSVTVGLSGGADSVALLLVLLELRECYSLSISACHINHCLRGAQSDSDQQFCFNLCRRLNIPFTFERIDIPALCRERGLGTEECAREARYEALWRASGSGRENSKIATAHTLSDSAETLLFNLSRGTGIDGLCGISPVRGNIIRPLIGVTRNEVEEFLRERGQDFVTDSTNSDNSYSRNRIRNAVIPELKALNPSFEEAVQRFMELNRQDCEHLEQQARAELERCHHPQGGLKGELLAALPPSLRTRVIRLFLRQNQLPYDHKRIKLLESKLQKGGGVNFTNSKTVVVQNGRLFLRVEILPHTEEKSFAITPNKKQIFTFGGRKIEISPINAEEIKLFVNNHRNEFKNCLDCDKIDGIMVLRTRREGDRITLAGRGYSKSLKKLMNEAKMSPQQRADGAVLQGKELLWVENFGVCAEAALSLNTKKAVIIKAQAKESNYE